ncbi:protein RECOGNITION OF PERONOSPORA PARASITICA 7-like [Humulus lupulus]|uniref:protein RECOGNITION OF PERONOSPORA PARASITICA 7-like n=1 Tax=Humulus lupulus TaxID=3486 RepID=UPI002B401DCC|nr:protein RECOGNITION OF PERONOSPORA PARASITICA 7-like [Humulus lupulus]
MDQHSIDVDIQVSVVTEKLSDLLAQQVFVHPRLRREVRWATNDLHEYLRRFRDSAQKHKMDKVVPEFELRVLQDCFMVDNITDIFLTTRTMHFQRQKGLMRPLIRFSSVWSQKFLMDGLKNIRLSFIDFWNNSLEELRLSTSGHDIEENLSSDTTSCYSSSLDTSLLSGVIGLEKEEEALVAQMLRSDELGCQLRVISIVGIVGCGKTTLAKTIYSRKDIKEHFQVKVWIHVSRSYSVRDLLIDICKQAMSMNEAKVLSEENYYSLRKGLTTILEENRYLIVMDDVWSTHLWDEVKHVFPDTKSGSRILLTTCDNEVARGGSSLTDQGGEFIQLNRLNDEDVWALFLKNMRWNEDRFNDSELAYFKNKVLRKCDGSPLAVTRLCSLLPAKSSDYHELLILIDDHVSSGDDQGHQSSFSYSLTLSYQNLLPRIRPCYLYMGLFPRAFEIPIRRLFRLWIAEGLVKPDSGSAQTPEDLAEDYFKELVNKNMIEVTRRKSDGRPKTCRIPGILYDVFSAKSMALGLFFVHKYTDYTSVTSPKFHVRRLVEYVDTKNYPSSDFYNQHLRSYISFNTRRRDTPAHEVGIFLDKLTAKRGFGLLRVLDLEGVYKPRLPESLGKLLQLRYLGLRWTFLDSLTDSVGGLVYLETLDVKHTNITTLSTSIWKAKNLRHLYMNEVHFDVSVQKRPRGSLTNLQTLWGLSVGSTSLVVNWLSKLVGLRKLGLTCHSTRIQAIADWISKLTNLQSLKLRSIDEFGQPSDLKLANMALHHKLTDLYLLGVLPKLAANEIFQYPPNLKILTLSGSQLGKESITLLGKLPHLNILRLFGSSYSSRQMECICGDFAELVVLKLWMLDELEEWKIEKGAMPHLRELEIRRCPNLKHVEGLTHLTTLKDLTLTNMPLHFVQNVKASMDEAISITVNEWKF